MRQRKANKSLQRKTTLKKERIRVLDDETLNGADGGNLTLAVGALRFSVSGGGRGSAGVSISGPGGGVSLAVEAAPRPRRARPAPYKNPGRERVLAANQPRDPCLKPTYGRVRVQIDASID